MMQFYLKEPKNYSLFFPLAMNRFVSDLVFGCLTLKERQEILLKKNVEVVSLRKELLKEGTPFVYNGYILDSTLILSNSFDPQWLTPNQVLKLENGEIVGFYADNLSIEQIYDDNYLQEYVKGRNIFSLRESQHFLTKVNNIAELLKSHDLFLQEELIQYLSLYKNLFQRHPKNKNVYFASDAKIGNFVELDASKGIILIDKGAQIKSFSCIEGPCYIGKNVKILQAILRPGNSFMHGCNVGGEVEASIFLEYTRKCHAGFIGHSYVGSFVNFGAMVNTSDLKNNYTTVNLIFENKITLKTNFLKLGSFIGDYSMLAIGTLLNTGSIIGLGCNIVSPVGAMIPKNVASFSWGDPAHFVKYRWNEFLAMIIKRRERKNDILSLQEQRVLQFLYDHQEIL